MRAFAHLVADVLDDMLAADFEDGFAPLEEADETDRWMPVDELPARPAAHARFPRRLDTAPRTGSRTRHRRPGAVQQGPMPCTSPISPRDDQTHKRG